MHYTQNFNSIFTPQSSLPKDLQKPRLRAEVMEQIYNDPDALFHFNQLEPDAQNALIEFCMGNRGLKITYDPFFHQIFHLEKHPERLNRLLSSILEQKVTVEQVLPREGIRLSEKSSLVIMDILVKLADGSLVNVEIQKYGYYFPMQRSFCYGADLLVRQYAQLRDALGKKFTYSSLQPVYVIVLMDNSPEEFSRYPTTFIHHSEFRFKSGLSLGNLLNFIYIPLDIFRNMPHNELGELEAWLYFLSSDNPLHIQRIVEKYPFFAELYQDIIQFRYHPKELITMYSEALAILDENTANLMIDDMKQKLVDKDATIAAKDAELSAKNAELAEKDALIAQLLQEKNQK